MTGIAYEWDEAKRAANRQKHEIDFMDALEVFERPHILIRSDRNGEERWGALGRLGERTIVVFFHATRPHATPDLGAIRATQ